MKKIISLAALFMMCAAMLSAQETIPAIPNPGNWTIEVGGGINSIFNAKKIEGVAPAVEVRIGKQLAPDAGVRLGFGGIQNAAPVNDAAWRGGRGNFLFWAIQGDLYWEPITTFAGYKEDRVYNLQPYARFEWLNTKETGVTNRELAAGVGLRNALRLNKRTSVYVDLSAVVSRELAYRTTGHYIAFPTLTAGFSFNIGKRGYKKIERVVETKEVPVEKVVEKIVERVVEVEKPAPAPKNAPVNSVIVLFDLGKADLQINERAKLEAFVNSLDMKDVKLIITGSADKATGNAANNMALSEKRAQAVWQALVGYCSLSPDQVTVKAVGDTANLGMPEENRSVTVAAYKK